MTNAIGLLAVLVDLRDRGRRAGTLEKIKIAEQIVEIIIPLMVDIYAELERMRAFPKPSADADHIAELERRLRVLEEKP